VHVAPLVSNENYFLASRPWNDILEPLNLNHIYEEIRFVTNHRHNQHRVCGFLPTAGDNCNLDYSGNGQGFAIAVAGKKEEDDGQEEGGC
jgi:hypothetical protein